MSHYYSKITTSARKTTATARGHKTTGIGGWFGSYDGVIHTELYHADGKDYATVELRTHPQRGNQTIAVLYHGALDAFSYKDRSDWLISEIAKLQIANENGVAS